MSWRRSARLTLWVLAASLPVVILSYPERVAADQQSRVRDRNVLETVLADMANPDNPLNRAYLETLGRPGRELVLDRYTLRGDAQLALLNRLESMGAVPRGLGADVRRRNLDGPFSVHPLGIQHQSVVIDDVSWLMRNWAPPDWGAPARAFWTKYPSAWGFVTVYLPGYSDDGEQAVVVADCGPSPHGIAVVYLLAKAHDIWEIRDRWQEVLR